MKRFFSFALMLVVAGAMLADDLSTLKSRYSSVKSVHVMAKGTLRLFRSDTDVVQGTMTFSYWADPTGYHAKCNSEPILEGVAGDSEISFDGRVTQYGQESMGSMSIGATEEPVMPLACPNPFFMPVEFLSPQSGTHSMKFNYLAQSGAWTMTTTRSLTNTNVYTLLAHGRKYEARFGTLGTSTTRIITDLTEFYPSGRKMVVQHFDYGAQAFPTKATMTAYQDVDGGVIGMQATWLIGVLEVNVPLDPTKLKLDNSGYPIVWDNDANMYVKHPQDSLVGKVQPTPAP